MVAVAVAGRALGPRRAAITGAVLGTLPDLDILMPFDDPVDSFVLHRSTTHSLLIHLLATPVIAEVVRRLFRGLDPQRTVVWAMVFLCLSTHALLDAFTIYGTQLLWPLSRYPFGIGSIFIIDPLYTLPLLVGTVMALASRGWAPGVKRATFAALAMSTAYLGWTLVGQMIARERGERILRDAGIEAEQLLATPMPFTSLVWRVIAIDGDRYLNLYLPTLAAERAGTIYQHPRSAADLSCLAGIPAASKLADFSKGFYRIDKDGETLLMSDIRMGVTPAYVFTFELARERDGLIEPFGPERRTYDRQRDGDLAWLLAGMTGEVRARPGEKESLVAVLPGNTSALQASAARTAGGGCAS